MRDAAVWFVLGFVCLGPILACASEEPATPQACIEWPAGRDIVDPRTGEKGVFLTEAEWQLLWDGCRD